MSALHVRVAGALVSGVLALDALWHAGADAPESFGRRYGGNPRSTGNGGQGRGNAARLQRAARKRRCLRARAPK